MASRIEDYGLIGDCETAALVGRDGSIDWLCWPAFDSDACFAALLGTSRNGRWLLAPAETIKRTSRRYRDDTLILETRFETNGGVVELIDFMPPRGHASDVVRLVRGISGRVKMHMELVIRFGFGVDVPWVKKNPDGGGLLAISGLVMWWKRRPPDLARGRIGAPEAPPGPRVRAAVIGIVLPLSILYPLTGLSLLVALLGERVVLALRRRLIT